VHAIAVVLPVEAPRRKRAFAIEGSFRGQPCATWMAQTIPYLAIEAALDLIWTQIVNGSRDRIWLGRVVLVGIAEASVIISEFTVELFFGESAVIMCIRKGLRSSARRLVPVSVIVVVVAGTMAIAAGAVMSGGRVRFGWRSDVGGVAAIGPRAG
jgi:hypothetical protein